MDYPEGPSEPLPGKVISIKDGGRSAIEKIDSFLQELNGTNKK
jgi:hypothetical protein